MSFMLLGILNSQVSGGGAAGAFDLLETTTLTSSAASVTFSGLGAYSDYKHLQIRGIVRKDAGTSDFHDNIQIVLNSDTGLNYAHHHLRGDGSSVISSNVANDDSIQILDVAPRSSATANAFGAFVTDILDFSSTSKNTTTRTFSGSTMPGESDVLFSSGLYVSTDAITSMTISPTSDGFITGSRFSLMGVK